MCEHPKDQRTIIPSQSWADLVESWKCNLCGHEYIYRPTYSNTEYTFKHGIREALTKENELIKELMNEQKPQKLS